MCPTLQRRYSFAQLPPELTALLLLLLLRLFPGDGDRSTEAEREWEKEIKIVPHCPPFRPLPDEMKTSGDESKNHVPEDPWQVPSCFFYFELDVDSGVRNQRRETVEIYNTGREVMTILRQHMSATNVIIPFFFFLQPRYT